MATAKDYQEQGIALFEKHDYEAAARAFLQAKDAYESAGQADMVAEMQVNVGLVHRALGENQQALELMQAAVRTFQERKDALRTAQALGNLGGVYVALNDKAQAHQAYRQAADTFRELGEMQMYARTLLAIGGLQLRSGEFLKGVATFKVAYEHLDNLSPTQKIIQSLFNFINRVSGTPLPQ
jgi:tetratricopeptide (TPR) repeat protein